MQNIYGCWFTLYLLNVLEAQHTFTSYTFHWRFWVNFLSSVLHLPLQATPMFHEDKNEMVRQDPDWQASRKGLLQRSAVMFNNELIADVHFIVGSGSNQRRIPAHKYILATGSSVFFAMFYGGLKEERNEITIPDVEPRAFLNLLR